MSERKPNFLLIVADDLGFSDVCCFGGEITTPNIDRLAREGIRFTDYHTASACSPTRSMLMSGTDNHLAGVGVMYEHKNMDPERWNVPGHEGYLNYDVAALPEVLSDNNYHNMLSGKWHLGFGEKHLPSARGFHRSWALLPGCNNHFGWEPAYLNGDGSWPRAPGHQPPLYVEDGKRVMPEANTSNSADGFYSSNFYATNLIKYLETRTEAERDQPFFAFLPFSAPHWPLQCLPEDRDAYKGRYEHGPEVLRQERLARTAQLGLIGAQIKPHTVFARTAEWDDLTSEEKKQSSRAMEVYAGMVTAMDRAIGKVLKHLEDCGELDNTVVIFQSDNGAEGAALEAAPIMGASLLDTIAKYYDNSYENLGNHNSFIWYGSRWAQASTAPNRLMKAFTTEGRLMLQIIRLLDSGGIRVPLILRYPGLDHRRGSICHAFTTAMDIMPTFLDMAGISHPNSNTDDPRSMAPYRNRQVYAMRGKSWVPFLQAQKMDELDDERDAIHCAGSEPIGWEQHGRASLRKGRWKIVFIPLGQPTGTGNWQLYDLAVDQGETCDLAGSYPEKLEELKMDWTRYQAETGIVFGPPIATGGGKRLARDQIGGDPTEDQLAWMKVSLGEGFTDTLRGRELSEKD